MEIRGTLQCGNYFEWEWLGRTYWVQGELYYNREKKRYEHHWGKILVWWE